MFIVQYHCFLSMFSFLRYNIYLLHRISRSLLGPIFFGIRQPGLFDYLVSRLPRSTAGGRTGDARA